MTEPDDLLRLKQEYADRKTRVDGKRLYSRFNPSYLYAMQHRERDTLALIKSCLGSDLSQRRILEVGCGSGGILLEYLLYGVQPKNLFGLDILFDRLDEAKAKIPAASILNANGELIPFISSSFDVILQYTAFSSILDSSIKKHMAQEMLRVLKPDGCMIWYDFWLNPTNKQTKGIQPAEIKALFPNCKIQFRKVTLAPPLARKIVPLSWTAAAVIESVGVFNTHYLALIRPGFDKN